MRKSSIIVMVLAIAIVLLAGCDFSSTDETDQDTDTESGLTVDEMKDIQNNTANWMIEIGERFWILFYAANDGNWNLAEYQMEEITELLEKNEITAPGRKDALETWQRTFGNELNASINAENIAEFKKDFNAAQTGCNGCHRASDEEFIKWVLPDERPPFYFTENIPAK